MTLPVFLHIEATPNPEEQKVLQTYRSQVATVIGLYGGIPIATYDVERALDDSEHPSIFSVVSFPDRQSIDDFFNDARYQSIIPLRNQGFRHIRFYITSERI